MKVIAFIIGAIVAVQVYAGHNFTSPTTGHQIIVTETVIVTVR